MSTSQDNNGDETVVAMVPCSDCGHLVPEANLALHHATACGARARRPSTPDETTSMEQEDHANLGVRQRRPWSTPTRPTRSAPSSSEPAEPVATPSVAATANTDEINRDNSAAGAPKDDGDAPNSPGVLGVADVVDLTSETTPQQQEWACPRCTLLNQPSESHCNACSYNNPDIVRPADPVRRERLIQDFNAPPPLLNRSSSSPLPSGATSGALLGGFLGAANAYMGGRSVGSGALEGAMTGFVGGAIVGEVFGDSSPTAIPSSSVASARSDAAMGLPPYPSMQPTSTSSSRRMQPRQSVRVVRHRNGRSGGYTTTIYTSGGETTHVGGSDPLLNLMMQSILSNGQGHAGVDNMSYEELLRAFGDGTENLGAEEGTIQNLPTAVLKDPSKELPADQLQCCICLENFKAQDKRKTLPCLHGFHQGCVDKWLRSNGSCPVCKHKVSS